MEHHMVRKCIDGMKLSLEQLHAIDEQYRNKNKGTVYAKRVSHWVKRYRHWANKLGQLGKGTIIQWGVNLDGKDYYTYYPVEISAEDIKIILSLQLDRELSELRKIEKIEMGKLIPRKQD